MVVVWSRVWCVRCILVRGVCVGRGVIEGRCSWVRSSEVEGGSWQVERGRWSIKKSDAPRTACRARGVSRVHKLHLRHTLSLKRERKRSVRDSSVLSIRGQTGGEVCLVKCHWRRPAQGFSVRWQRLQGRCSGGYGGRSSGEGWGAGGGTAFSGRAGGGPGSSRQRAARGSFGGRVLLNEGIALLQVREGRVI
jgi:hypothetical protein